ncbi:hypothetical protein [Homoserinibacter sp. YIM 151385]|uniref:hypothetical protein n=1 Tax=Homoserinibacter sp. YIM 151385 TaxID=2985506 RepID=UPI0022F13F57|nr:hypothetical protein [Homoserinibacter sp. YIM 151385]WBU37068.1 hypothetical protein OF852_09035 [Homoserinibacter sp. YIM 151385]
MDVLAIIGRTVQQLGVIGFAVGVPVLAAALLPVTSRLRADRRRSLRRAGLWLVLGGVALVLLVPLLQLGLAALGLR